MTVIDFLASRPGESFGLSELARATGGAPAKFRSFMSPYVGPGRQFASASLWPLGKPNPAPSAVVGAAPVLASLPGVARQFFARASRVRPA